jgi:hypothetical protein
MEMGLGEVDLAALARAIERRAGVAINAGPADGGSYA